MAYVGITRPVACSHLHPLGICKISKKNVLIGPLKSATPNRNGVLPPLNGRGWRQLIFKSVCICKMFCAVLHGAMCK